VPKPAKILKRQVRFNEADINSLRSRLRFAPTLPFGPDRKALSLPKLVVYLISRAVRQRRVSGCCSLWTY